MQNLLRPLVSANLQVIAESAATYVLLSDNRAGNLDIFLKHGGKLAVFGPPPEDRLSRIGLCPNRALPDLAGMDAADLNEKDFVHLSPGKVRYTDHPLALLSPLRERHFWRYDYAEWNNLGYGGIKAGPESPFAVQGGIDADGAEVLAIMETDPEITGRREYLGPYMTLLDRPGISILWCQRPAGPVDSVEWQVIERFFSDWRAEELPCLPCLVQVPAGFNCVVTMRLDCDEAVASARPLFAAYRDFNAPFSLAVKTGEALGEPDLSLLRDVLASGGSVMSHSHTHPKNWGENYTQALQEINASRQWFVDNALPLPDLAVSPFHTNPAYAMQALEKAGIRGVVGGIIDNDPEYLLGRAGIAPQTENLLTISQQSMLHGDSYRNQGHAVDVHLQAFKNQYAARGIFGYLDHPFSRRYQYGWDSEEQRIAAHAELVSAMQSEPGVLFWNQEQCFDFVRALADTRLEVDGRGRVRTLKQGNCPGGYALRCRYQGQELVL